MLLHRMVQGAPVTTLARPCGLFPALSDAIQRAARDTNITRPRTANLSRRLQKSSVRMMPPSRCVASYLDHKLLLVLCTRPIETAEIVVLLSPWVKSVPYGTGRSFSIGACARRARIDGHTPTASRLHAPTFLFVTEDKASSFPSTTLYRLL